MANYKPTRRQMEGSEFGGVENTTATIQPKPPEALTPGERLRLLSLTGQDTDTEALLDRRAMWGLSTEGRPNWLGGTGKESEAERQGIGEE